MKLSKEENEGELRVKKGKNAKQIEKQKQNHWKQKQKTKRMFPKINGVLKYNDQYLFLLSSTKPQSLHLKP